MSRHALLPAFALTLVLATLSGCALGPREPLRYFVLSAEPALASSSAASRPATLLVTPTTATAFYESQDIVFSRQPGVRASYQFSHWTEPPSAAVHSTLVDRLEAAGVFRTVVQAGRGMRGDLVLDTALREIYHDASSNPGTARIVLSAELRDPVKRVVVARRVFDVDAPATSFDAPGAVAGFRVALGRLGVQLTEWLASLP
jgi:cholesterol transport system auxiliary component